MFRPDLRPYPTGRGSGDADNMETNVHQPIVVGYDGSAYADRALRWAADESTAH